MNASELQAKLLMLERLLNRQRGLSDAQRTDIINLRGQVHRLTGDKQKLEAERQRLSSQLNQLTNKLGSK